MHSTVCTVLLARCVVSQKWGHTNTKRREQAQHSVTVVILNQSKLPSVVVYLTPLLAFLLSAAMAESNKANLLQPCAQCKKINQRQALLSLLPSTFAPDTAPALRQYRAVQLLGAQVRQGSLKLPHFAQLYKHELSKHSSCTCCV
jgi:hypothetical protein